MALAGGESTSSASVAEEQTDPVEPCLPARAASAPRRARAEDGEGCEPRESRGGLWDDL
jgi:hypothetical protein